MFEYGNIIYGPFYKGYENPIERIQRKATRLVTFISQLSYEEQLRHLNLPSLKYRRYHGDMITAYNIMQGNLNLDRSLSLLVVGQTLEDILTSYSNLFPSIQLDNIYILKELLMTGTHFLSTM